MTGRGWARASAHVASIALAVAVVAACGSSEDSSVAEAGAGEGGGLSTTDAGGGASDDASDPGTGDDSGALGDGGGGTNDAGGDAAAKCNQADIEPNGTQALARPLASTTDCDKNGNSIKGTSDGSTDDDFYKFHGNDNLFCEVNPTATIATAGFSLCLFAVCDAGGGSVSCKSGTATTVGALSGCCIDSPSSEEIGVNCPGFDDSSTVYMRVRQKSGTACRNYTITYHY